MRQIIAAIRWEKKFLVSFIALGILVILGPFGTYADLNLGQRFVYWTILMIGIGTFMHIFVSVAITTPYLGKAPQWVRMVLGAMLAAIPSVAILAFVNEIYRPDQMPEFSILLKWAQITLLGMVIGTAEYMDWRRPTTLAPTDITTALHGRLSANTGTDIISLSMQDHYVEVTTAANKELILMRFSDALDEVAGLAGQRVHRSHWVAEKHLRRVDKDGQRHIATLSDGRTLPVSNTYHRAVQAAMDRALAKTQK